MGLLDAPLTQIKIIDDDGNVLEVNPDGSVNVIGSITATTTLDLHRESVTVTGMSTSPVYSSGDQMGGQVTVPNMAASSGGSGYLTSATLFSKTPGILGAVRAWVFSDSVTPATDNTGVSFSDTDMALCLGTIVFPAPASEVNGSIATITNVNLDYALVGTSMFVCLETTILHTVNFGSTSDLVLAMSAVRL